MIITFDTADRTVIAALTEAYEDAVYHPGYFDEKPQMGKDVLVAFMTKAIQTAHGKAYRSRTLQPWLKKSALDWTESEAPTWLLRMLERVTIWKGVNWDHASDDLNVRIQDAEHAGVDDPGQPLDKPHKTIQQLVDAGVLKDERVPAQFLLEAEAVGSKIVNDAYYSNHLKTPHHYVILDIDYSVLALPSSTPGHYHLIFDKIISARQWRTLMKSLSRAGLIESGYSRWSRYRGEAYLRLPWIRKGSERDDAATAMSDWLLAEEGEEGRWARLLTKRRPEKPTAETPLSY